MRHHLSLPSLFLLSACGAATSPIAMRCAPVGDTHLEGAPVSVRVELVNESGGEVTILGSTVPWQYEHAIELSADGFEAPRSVVDPGDEPNIPLAAGESDRGDVDVTERLRSAGRSFAERAGTYQIRASARPVLAPGTPDQREVQVSCDFEVTIEAADGARGRAYARAIAAAEAGGMELSQYRLTSLSEREGRFYFDFEHVYPAPPGGHFGVVVDESGAAQLMPGE
jgi:hypothetical protein